jgi:hypothetical protein
MTPEAQRIAIAEACGLTGWQEARALPNYLNDLNAMHEAEKYLTNEAFEVYIGKLRKMFIARDNAHCATAAQRAEAFLRTLNLWTP